MIDLKMMIKDYEPDDSIFSDEEPNIIMLKKAIQNLNPADKIILLLYAEYGSLRKTAKELNVSHTTIFKQINLIKEQIKEYCNNKYPNNNMFGKSE